MSQGRLLLATVNAVDYDLEQENRKVVASDAFRFLLFFLDSHAGSICGARKSDECALP